MNKRSVIDQLEIYLRSILYHLDFPSDLVSLIYGSGYELKFFALFVTRLQQLSAMGIQATVLREFEPLGGGLYSMHLSGQGYNIRILYGFMPNGQPVLLLAFHERAGKAKTDYSSHIPEAQKRFAEYKKGYDHES